MKQIFILFFTISYATYAQSSVENTGTHEQKARMSSKQRMQLKAFESLSVIDTDENRSYVFRNGQWAPEFSDAQILAARNQQQSLKNTNASWKEFDELSRPADAGAPKNTVLSAGAPEQGVSRGFVYETIDVKEFASNGFSMKIPESRQVSFMKIYFNKAEGLDELVLEGSKARKSQSDKVVSFKYFESGLSSISFGQEGIKRIVSANNEITGVLLAYLD